MNTVFVDTGYLFALEIANDQHHQAATQHWQGIVTALPRLVTTSYVFDEVLTFFNSRGQHAKAMQVGNNLLQSPSVQFIHVDTALFYEGWAGLDHGIGHFMLFEADSEARAPAPPIPKSRQTSSAASDRKSALLPWSRQAE